jgi:tetratricopeptide (TPR) repeat protein
MRQNHGIPLLPVFVIAGLGLLIVGCQGNSTPESWASQIEQSLAAQDYEEAIRLGKEGLAEFPQSSQLRWLASHAHYRNQEFEDALALLLPVLDQPGPDQQRILFAAGELEIQLGHGDDAERHLRQLIKLQPQFQLAWQRLAYLLTIQGRSLEAVPLRFALLQSGQFTITDLLFLGNPRAIAIMPELEQFRSNNPDHPTMLLANARIAIGEDQLEEARGLLRDAIRGNPGLVEAQAWLGMLLLELPDKQPFIDWYQALPEGIQENSDMWVVQGLWSQDQGQPRAAARCFWEALKLDPNHQIACYQLATSLALVGHLELALKIQDRARQLQELEMAVTQVNSRNDDLELLGTMARLTERLGRYWEAYGWHNIILAQRSSSPVSRTALNRLQQHLTSSAPQVADQRDPARIVDLAGYPLPEMQRTIAPPPAPRDDNGSRVHFSDIAPGAGIRFTYFNADDPATEGRRMFEFTGGGAAVLDFDGDLWPDIYLTQGCPWPPDPGQQEYRDRLFRNLGDGTFEDVTEQAGLGDNRFSQGIQVGDFDNDGFPDIYLANVGENRLYRNNGDGTFADVTGEAGAGGARWTSSCLLADLNGDGLADLYEVNYLSGEGVFDLICDRENGRARSCSPTEFDAQQDRVMLNLGNGKFQDVTDQSGIVTPDGKGLGIVAADFHGSGMLSLFIANDMTANFYFINRNGPGEPLDFVEQAVISGLAYDRDGKAQSCMGIALDDADADGLLDMHVTNFYKESNTLYVQQSAGIFRDRTRQARLREPGFNLLGFGTQFLDAQLDGQPDLVVANGHVDDYTYQGSPFQMRPQFLCNVGGIYLDQGETAGDYFGRKLLGRGLTVGDLNRDGKPDFIVSHLDAPVAVLANDTPEAGNYLALQLRGRTIQRDAIGSRVAVTIRGDNPRELVRQLTAGDGYLASNQRQLLIGLGEDQQVEKLQVTWINGKVDTYMSVPVNRQVVVIEGDPELHLLPEPGNQAGR